MALAAGTKLGPYEILAPIGAGGMGEVYRARDTRLAREVAIKVSAERFSERFEKEAHAIAALNHPNICTLHDVGPNYLVMELVEGPTLADRTAIGKIPLSETLVLARQIVDALEAAHEKNIVHRDLKPANIKVKPDGTVKVLDFGLAKIAEPGAPGNKNLENSPTLTLQDATRTGVILGTAGYMSPEQASGKPVDKRADIWAFGVVLWEMLTGRRMFAGETVSHTIAAVLIKGPDWQQLSADTPPSLKRLLKRCLDRDLKRRLTDIGTARLEIEAAAEEKAEPVAATMPSRSQLVWVLATVSAVLAILLGGVSLLYFREARPELRTVRFQIPPPEKGGFQFSSISPDGRSLAFMANNQLWIRALDSLESRLLVGTEGTPGLFSGPFWSPDSQFVGFARQGKLQKIAASGGPAQAVCDVTTFSGGTWNRDGVIVFGQIPSLFRVSEAGGTAVQVIKRGEGQQVQVFPEFLPDGRHFLYTTLGGKAEAGGIFVGSLDGEPAARLLADPTNASYAQAVQSGYLMFIRGGTLMAQPFDSARRRLSGALFPVAENVGGNFTIKKAFSVSPNGTLVYGLGGGPVTTQLLWKDRGGKSVENFGPPGIYNSFRLSPDEKRIAFDSNQSGNADIWVLDSARGAASRLTFDPATDNLPIWSPDGLHIVWPSRRGGIGFDLYIKSANGTGPESLLVKMGSPTGWAADWSKDGRFILYQRQENNTGQDLWIAPQLPEGAAGDRKPFAYLQSPFDEKEGKFSPDGKWVAYVSNESGRDEVYVQSFPLSGAKFQISTTGGWEPQWRKDGSELFYIAADQTLMAVPIKLGRTGVESFQQGLPKPLFAVSTETQNSYAPRNYAVSNDGQRFLVRNSIGEIAPPLTIVLNWQAGLRK